MIARWNAKDSSLGDICHFNLCFRQKVDILWKNSEQLSCSEIAYDTNLPNYKFTKYKITKYSHKVFTRNEKIISDFAIHSDMKNNAKISHDE